MKYTLEITNVSKDTNYSSEPFLWEVRQTLLSKKITFNTLMTSFHLELCCLQITSALEKGIQFTNTYLIF